MNIKDYSSNNTVAKNKSKIKNKTIITNAKNS